jgi:hypothetical protein
MTKIIHFKVPTLENTKGASVRDQFTMSPVLVVEYAKLLKEALLKGTGENWVVLVSPFDDIKILQG